MAAIASAKKLPPPRPMPPETAGRWLDVDYHDPEMVVRWLLVNQQMHRHYLRETIHSFCNALPHKSWEYGGSYYFWKPGYEIVIRFCLFPQRKQHMVQSIGFVGDIPPAQALDLAIEQTVRYLRERKAASVFAAVPRKMDHAGIVKLYELVPRHPRMRVTTEYDGPHLRRWNIEFPELQTS